MILKGLHENKRLKDYIKHLEDVNKQLNDKLEVLENEPRLLKTLDKCIKKVTSDLCSVYKIEKRNNELLVCFIECKELIQNNHAYRFYTYLVMPNRYVKLNYMDFNTSLYNNIYEQKDVVNAVNKLLDDKIKIRDNEIHITDIISDLSLVNNGYGSFAMENVKEYLSINGYKKLKGRLSPVDKNDHLDRLIAFYKKNGFTIDENDRIECEIKRR